MKKIETRKLTYRMSDTTHHVLIIYKWYYLTEKQCRIVFRTDVVYLHYGITCEGDKIIVQRRF